MNRNTKKSPRRLDTPNTAYRPARGVGGGSEPSTSAPKWSATGGNGCPPARGVESESHNTDPARGGQNGIWSAHPVHTGGKGRSTRANISGGARSPTTSLANSGGRHRPHASMHRAVRGDLSSMDAGERLAIAGRDPRPAAGADIEFRGVVAGSKASARHSRNLNGLVLRMSGSLPDLDQLRPLRPVGGRKQNLPGHQPPRLALDRYRQLCRRLAVAIGDIPHMPESRAAPRCEIFAGNLRHREEVGSEVHGELHHWVTFSVNTSW